MGHGNGVIDGYKSIYYTSSINELLVLKC